MSKAILMVILHGAVGKTAVVGDKLQFTPHGLPYRGQPAKVSVDGKTFDSDCVGSQVLPEPCPPRGIHLGVYPDLDVELREARLDRLQ